MSEKMTGAQSLIRTLLASGVDVCFTNPGTSEMHFVAALDSIPEMRSVLGLFEGVVTGAADGYARMADRPASTLLHLGPGLGNGLACLHNARKAGTPVVNIVGDHATYFSKFDAPLQSDVETIAKGVSGWIRSSRSADEVAKDAAEAVAAAEKPPGQVATLILPADVSWGASPGPAPAPKRPEREPVAGPTVDEIARLLKSDATCALLLDGPGLRTSGLEAASRVAGATGARLMCNTFFARLERGAGRPALERIPYFPEMVTGTLEPIQHLILVGAKKPVGFFAYPGLRDDVVPDSCQVHELASPSQDVQGVLENLAEAVGAKADGVTRQERTPLSPPSGASLDPHTIAVAIAAAMPENTIICDEGNTAGAGVQFATQGAPPHDWLCLTGGAIGHGPPMATGAALACPDRRVISLQADGSAMYTLQALWTQAREGLNVTTVLLANRAYAILNMEMQRLGLGAAGDVAKRMLDIDRPALDFVKLASGMGVSAARATSGDELVKRLSDALATEGPSLIEAVL